MEFTKNTDKMRLFALRSAIILSFLILGMMLLAIFNIAEMYRKVKEIQTLLGGFSVLAASLFAFYANTAAAAESYRKNLHDENSLKENTMINLVLSVEALRQQSHARLVDLHKQTGGYVSEKVHFQFLTGLSISTPEHVAKVWENINFLDGNIFIPYLNLINFSNMAEAERKHTAVTCTFTREECSKLIIELEAQIGKGSVNDQVNDLRTKIYQAGIEAGAVTWSRLGGLLSDINWAAIELLKKLPLSHEWKPELAPYPPSFKSHQYTTESARGDEGKEG